MCEGFTESRTLPERRKEQDKSRNRGFCSSVVQTLDALFYAATKNKLR
jgi:hypothetical protein